MITPNALQIRASRFLGEQSLSSATTTRLTTSGGVGRSVGWPVDLLHQRLQHSHRLRSDSSSLVARGAWV